MNAIVEQLASGALTPVTIVVWTILSFVLAVLGGAIGGMQLGGKDLGNKLAAMMGGMYGPVAAVPGILLALLVFTFL